MEYNSPIYEQLNTFCSQLVSSTFSKTPPQYKMVLGRVCRALTTWSRRAKEERRDVGSKYAFLAPHTSLHPHSASNRDIPVNRRCQPHFLERQAFCLKRNERVDQQENARKSSFNLFDEQRALVERMAIKASIEQAKCILPARSRLSDIMLEYGSNRAEASKASLIPLHPHEPDTISLDMYHNWAKERPLLPAAAC